MRAMKALIGRNNEIFIGFTIFKSDAMCLAHSGSINPWLIPHPYTGTW